MRGLCGCGERASGVAGAGRNGRSQVDTSLLLCIVTDLK